MRCCKTCPIYGIVGAINENIFFEHPFVLPAFAESVDKCFALQNQLLKMKFSVLVMRL